MSRSPIPTLLRSGGGVSQTMPIQVAIRTRPTASFASENMHVGDDKCSLTVKLPKGENPNAQDSWSWRFDSVLHNASQETTYNDTVLPIVTSVLSGINGTVMCYGQTGAGKTFTQIGATDSYQNRGITPRAIHQIFEFIAQHPELECAVSVTYVEIYQDTFIDLLADKDDPPPAEGLALAEEKSGATYVKNARSVPIDGEQEALTLVFAGQNNRHIENHELNRNSTRGHAIFTLAVRIKSRVDSSGKVKVSKLNLVDLAGSERLKKTATVGVLATESMFINKSLTYLEQVRHLPISPHISPHLPASPHQRVLHIPRAGGGRPREQGALTYPLPPDEAHSPP